MLNAAEADAAYGPAPLRNPRPFILPRVSKAPAVLAAEENAPDAPPTIWPRIESSSPIALNRLITGSRTVLSACIFVASSEIALDESAYADC